MQLLRKHFAVCDKGTWKCDWCSAMGVLREEKVREERARCANRAPGSSAQALRRLRKLMPRESCYAHIVPGCMMISTTSAFMLSDATAVSGVATGVLPRAGTQL